MTLHNDHRHALWASEMQRKSAAGEHIPLDKPEYRAALNAIDDAFDEVFPQLAWALPAALREKVDSVIVMDLLISVAIKRREEVHNG